MSPSTFRLIKPKPENKERLKQACSTAVSALQTTLRIAAKTTGDSGAPSLQAGIGGLVFVLDAIKKTSQNAKDIEALSKQIEELNQALEKSKDGKKPSATVIDPIDRLFSASNSILEELRKIISHSAMKRFIRHDDDARLISGHIQSITSSFQRFTVETMVAIQSAVDGHAVKTEEKIDSLHEATKIGFQELKINPKVDTKDVRPPYANLSPFDSKDRVGCLEGTRTDILNQIFRWIGIADSQLQGARASKGKSKEASPILENTCIFWINGGARTGKTTIAYTISEVCRRCEILGASFFCSRDDADCSNPRLVFTSIAYQLGNWNALFRAEVSRAMESNPNIGYSSTSYQLEQLIVKPLRALGGSFSPCVVVVDALDECKDIGMTSVILSSLSLHIKELFPLKFLVTSRPESHIIAVFKSNNLNPVTQRYILHEVELDVVQSDIELYLSTKLASTRELYRIKDEWPSEADIHSLTVSSSALFYFASTSVRFIEDRNYSDPRHQLARLLCNAPTTTEDSSPHYNLDRLYDQVLNHAFPKISSTLSGRLQKILGTIVLLRDPLSSLAMERLLGVQLGSVQETLHHLHSVIMVPDDDSKVIRTLHPSFFDFITSSARCQNPNFVVNPGSQHTLLAHACLVVLKRLKRDICGIRNPSLLNNEVDNLPTRVTTCIGSELQYACRHWAWHLSNATLDILINPLNEFCSKYLLYWVEALSLMGDLRKGVLALDTAHQAIAKAGGNMTHTVTLLRDCEWFTLKFFSIISICSLQVYHSALLFTPEEALIKETYRRELDIPITVYNGLDQRWNSCIQTMEGHSTSVDSVTFSPDGTRIVSGSLDKIIRLWDAFNSGHLNTSNGPSGSVYSVAFSPNGRRIISGSHDKTVRLWDAVGGANLDTFLGHPDSVTSVAFSPDGKRLVSGSYDKAVQLWNGVSSVPLNTSNGHSDLVCSLVFSPDGTRIVSGSLDKTIRLRDAGKGGHLNTPNGHSGSVYSVAFSPDGRRIVAGSYDKTVRLWNVFTRTHLNTFKRHLDSVKPAAFSPNGTRIVSGSSSKTVRLWDTVTDAHLNMFMSHSSLVKSIAFSPDSLVSGPSDQTDWLWDPASRAHLDTSIGHSNPVTSVAFSPDDTRIVSGFLDKTIGLWDAVNDGHLNTSNEHSGSVYSVATSPMAGVSFPDPTTKLFGCGTQSAARISTLSRDIPAQVVPLPSQNASPDREAPNDPLGVLP